VIVALPNRAYATLVNVFGKKEAVGTLIPSLGSNWVLRQGGKIYGFSFSKYNKRGGSYLIIESCHDVSYDFYGEDYRLLS
jgi:hypothetical protein